MCTCRYTDIWELSAFLKDKAAGLLLVEQVGNNLLTIIEKEEREKRNDVVLL